MPSQLLPTPQSAHIINIYYLFKYIIRMYLPTFILLKVRFVEKIFSRLSVCPLKNKLQRRDFRGTEVEWLYESIYKKEL